MIKLYNTASRRIEAFKPLSTAVKLYSCGPTVYDYAHLGNLRAYVFVDTLRRVLEVHGFKVHHVMNITDVGHLSSDADEGEDKLEKSATSSNKTVWEVADFYAEEFKKDTARLNLLRPNGYRGQKDEFARATDFIAQQIEIISLLLKKGFAYTTEQAIYFDIHKIHDYGFLAGQKIDEKAVGARDEVITDTNKRNPLDFALWFFTVGRFRHHSMRWPSPWGTGFPGWHLECSAIIHATLSETIDIHTGGVDHIGTHHPNEIAQSEAAFEKKLSNWWMHNEHLHVNGKKMSKSDGNFFTLKDIEKAGFEPMSLRLLFLQSHYRSHTNLTWESLKAAQIRLWAYRSAADIRWQLKDAVGHTIDWPGAQQKILCAVENDLNTPRAISVLNELMDIILTSPPRKGAERDFYAFFEFLDELFGLKLLQSEDISPQQKVLIKTRERFRANQKWDEADEVRKALIKMGIELRDTNSGTIWSRLQRF